MYVSDLCQCCVAYVSFMWLVLVIWIVFVIYVSIIEHLSVASFLHDMSCIYNLSLYVISVAAFAVIGLWWWCISVLQATLLAILMIFILQV